MQKTQKYWQFYKSATKTTKKSLLLKKCAIITYVKKNKEILPKNVSHKKMKILLNNF